MSFMIEYRACNIGITSYKHEYMCVLGADQNKFGSNPINQKMNTLIVIISDKFYNINNEINIYYSTLIYFFWKITI